MTVQDFLQYYSICNVLCVTKKKSKIKKILRLQFLDTINVEVWTIRRGNTFCNWDIYFWQNSRLK